MHDSRSWSTDAGTGTGAGPQSAAVDDNDGAAARATDSGSFAPFFDLEGPSRILASSPVPAYSPSLLLADNNPAGRVVGGGGGGSVRTGSPDAMMPSSHSPPPPTSSHHSSSDPGTGPFGSIGSNRRKPPPLKSTTMDDSLPTGPTQGTRPVNQWGSPGEHIVNSSSGTTQVGSSYHRQHHHHQHHHHAAHPLPGLMPRAPGLYNQQNHSSPSLAVSLPHKQQQHTHPHPHALYDHQLHSSTTGNAPSPLDPPVIPALPSLDDINLGLESMHFEQRSASATLPSASQIDDHHRAVSLGGAAAAAAATADGAMEIRSPQGHTASVYSVDSVYSNPSSSINLADRQQQQQQQQHFGSAQHSRQASAASHRAYMPGPTYGDSLNRRRDSGLSGHADSFENDGAYLPYDPRYSREGGGGPSPGTSIHTHTPSPQPYPASDAYAAPGSSHGQHYNPDGLAYYHPDDERQQMHAPFAPPPGSSGPYDHAAQAQYYAPQFQPQPPPQHAMYGYDHASLTAAQNPYYAAATGQLGFPGGEFGAAPNMYGGQLPASLSRAPSSVSGMSVMSGPQGLGRSQSSVNVPGPGMRRKPTSASTHSGTSTSSGPPITKQSVDEYRNRIKADPDPEAQFNFAKYLIEAAKKITTSAAGDEKAAKKYRDALLAESLKLIKRLATQGSTGAKTAYPDAQFFLANCLGNGSLGLQVDHEKAYNLYVQASKQNHSSATYRTAVCNEVGVGTRRDHARAVLFYRKASALGDTAGMYKLGMILLNGLLGQQRNPKEGYTWLKRAASQADEDNPHALHELGLLYERVPASGQPQYWPYDPAQARELFTQAGQLGYPPSQFKLGSCYEYGSLTCPVDPRRSIAWYTRAAERGDAESELALSGWYLTGSDGVLKQSDSEAYLWARRAANKGLPKAEYAVGYYSEVGIGVKQDLEEAKRWYMRAAAQGNKRAMQRLTELKKLGAEKGKRNARPTRQEAATECVVS